MGLFDFFKKATNAQQEDYPAVTSVEIDKLKGKDFEFLITGEIEIVNDRFDDIMTPNSLTWAKVIRDDWQYYIVGDDEYSYSMEPPGIQMVFNGDIKYSKAKKIADEIIENIKSTGQDCQLVMVNTSKIYKV